MKTTYFATVPEWLLGSVSCNAIAVYCVIDRKADKAGRAWPSHRLIAETLSVSEAKVKRAVAELVDVGAVERIPRFRDDGSRTSNNYKLLRDPPRYTGDQGGRYTGDPTMNQSQIEPEKILGEGQKARPRDQLWDMLVEVLKTEPATKTERGRWNYALRELREANATPQEIKTRARTYRQRFPDAALTPTALAANWGSLHSPQKPRLVEPEPEPEGPWVAPPTWQQILKDMPA